MSFALKNLFQTDYERYDGVRKINIYLMRFLYTLMLLFLGKDSWSYILTHQDAWDPNEAMAWCVWTAFATLAGLGLIHPVKMIPILLLEIFYKVLWLILVAYPLWKAGKLAGSSAEGMTYAFLPVIIAIAAVPWDYVFRNYFAVRRPSETFPKGA
jgi:hypothetical protein